MILLPSGQCIVLTKNVIMDRKYRKHLLNSKQLIGYDKNAFAGFYVNVFLMLYLICCFVYLNIIHKGRYLVSLLQLQHIGAQRGRERQESPNSSKQRCRAEMSRLVSNNQKRTKRKACND